MKNSFKTIAIIIAAGGIISTPALASTSMVDSEDTAQIEPPFEEQKPTRNMSYTTSGTIVTCSVKLDAALSEANASMGKLYNKGADWRGGDPNAEVEAYKVSGDVKITVRGKAPSPYPSYVAPDYFPLQPSWFTDFTVSSNERLTTRKGVERGNMTEAMEGIREGACDAIKAAIRKLSGSQSIGPLNYYHPSYDAVVVYHNIALSTEDKNKLLQQCITANGLPIPYRSTGGDFTELPPGSCYF